MRSFKEAAQGHTTGRKKDSEYLDEYLDKMHEPLNQHIRDHVHPHWRDHASLKGKYLCFNSSFSVVQAGSP